MVEAGNSWIMPAPPGPPAPPPPHPPPQPPAQPQGDLFWFTDLADA